MNGRYVREDIALQREVDDALAALRKITPRGDAGEAGPSVRVTQGLKAGAIYPSRTHIDVDLEGRTLRLDAKGGLFGRFRRHYSGILCINGQDRYLRGPEARKLFAEAFRRRGSTVTMVGSPPQAS